MAPILEGAHVRLRPFRGSDLKLVHRLYGNAENLRYWDSPPSPSLDRSRTILHWHLGFRASHYVLWAVEERATRRAVGMINYNSRDIPRRRANLGWLLLPEHQGKGYMTEAGGVLLRHLFDELGLHKVEALIHPDNKKSAALARRLGFRLEGGPIRDRWLLEGRWHSVMIYGLIAGEERAGDEQ
jgi:ribosomal-protein-alanine N-acetyltransferase